MAPAYAIGGLFVGLSALFAIIIMVTIGLSVGLDAKSRGIRPAAVWGLVAALAPGLLGVIGYLIVRYLDGRDN